MNYVISMIPYANMAPYRSLGCPAGCQWLDCVPRQSSIALREGITWAAAAPVGDLPALAGVVDCLGEYGIAAAGPVGSVLLFSDLPFEQLDASARVRITSQSSSSVRLLYLLLHDSAARDRMPAAVAKNASAEADLLIGDAALVRARRPGRRFVFDLAEMWLRRTRLPFVFARWVIRKDAPPELSASMIEWLDKLREQDAELVTKAAPAEAARLSLSEGEMLAYLRGITRAFGPDELRGQARFLDELAKLDPMPFLAPATPQGMHMRRR